MIVIKSLFAVSMKKIMHSDLLEHIKLICPGNSPPITLLKCFPVPLLIDFPFYSRYWMACQVPIFLLTRKKDGEVWPFMVNAICSESRKAIADIEQC